MFGALFSLHNFKSHFSFSCLKLLSPSVTILLPFLNFMLDSVLITSIMCILSVCTQKVIYVLIMREVIHVSREEIYRKLHVHAQSCPDPGLEPASPTLQPGYWSGQPFPSPGDLPDPGIEPRSPTLQADSLPSEPPWRPKEHLSH